ncbi:hypothetical protein GWK47_046739 [Chionoecetes opilio]|uniref:Uncharacterized protein n=1 Tax=Chionoecetes opilio TaxID=41210 RepID=A0A8J4Y657_CHIOP|nr:hypothetical protein GWK47_046739 [Chionoecetes opilio]
MNGAWASNYPRTYSSRSAIRICLQSDCVGTGTRTFLCTRRFISTPSLRLRPCCGGGGWQTTKLVIAAGATVYFWHAGNEIASLISRGRGYAPRQTASWQSIIPTWDLRVTAAARGPVTGDDLFRGPGNMWRHGHRNPSCESAYE